MGPASRPRTARACYSAACGRMRPCRDTAWAWPWCTTQWPCTAARSRSMPRPSAAHASRCACRGAEARRRRLLRRDLELDSLRQRQVAAPVHRVGLAAHVGLPGIRARFAAAAGVLLPAERPADLRTGGAEIDVGDAAVTAGGGEEGLGVLQPVGEKCRGQPVRCSVLCLD